MGLQIVEQPVLIQVQWYAGECRFGDSGQQQLRLAIRRQLEWCFSDANLSRDELLHDKICEALPGGWLCCWWLIATRKVVPFHTTVQLILESLHGSHLETCMASSGDVRHGNDPLLCLFLRRRQPLPPLLRIERGALGGLGVDMPLDPEKAVLRDPHGTMNRLKDHLRVQAQLHIREVGDCSTIFFERLQENDGRHGGTVVAVGYERVLYGDDGPYIELNSSQVKWDAWPFYHSKKGYQSSYYDEYYTKASHSAWCRKWDEWDPHPNEGLLMLYAQTHAVNDRPWAPSASSRPHAWRPRGYADYRPGYYYITADENLITAVPPRSRMVTTRSGRRCSEPHGGSLADDEEGRSEPSVEPRDPKTGADAELLQPLGAVDGVTAASSESSGWGLCWDFQAGTCRRGDKCKWAHA